MAIFPGSAIFGEVEPAYEIDHSCRFEQSDSAYLSRTPGSTGNVKTWTISCWVKLGAVTGNRHIMSSGGPSHSGGADISLIVWNPNLQLYMYPNGGPAAVYLNTASAYRDPSAWYHLVFMLDTTQAVEANRAKIWVNGEEPALESATYPTLNADGAGFYINSTQRQVIAHEDERWRYEFDGYLAEFYMIDGTNLTASSFGKLNSNNQWVPLASDDVKDAVTFGTNGFYLDFADSADLGDDDSGEGNDYASTNLVAYDQMIDTPTNNFATLNPLANTGTLSEANLKVATTTTERFGSASTIAPVDKKWYAEIYLVSYITAPVWMLGISRDLGTDYINDYPVGSKTWSYSYDASTGVAYNNDVSVPEANPYGSSATTGDIMGIAYDMENNELYFSVNGTWQNSANPASGTGGISVTSPVGSPLGTYVIVTGDGSSTKGTTQVINFGQDSSFAGNKTSGSAEAQDSNGKGDFYYTPPTDFLALCTDNLSAPDIALPGGNFNTKLFTGTGSELAITGVGFQPDFTWIKTRELAYNNRVFDVGRGVTKELYTNATNAEVTDAQSLKSFDSDGFTLGTSSGVNPSSSSSMVSWNWKASGATSSNTTGSLASSVSANTAAGFSIVTYTGTGNDETVGHGLSEEPELIWVFRRTDAGYFKIISTTVGGLSFAKYFRTDDVGAAGTGNYWQDLNPGVTTAGTFTIVGADNSTNGSGDTFVGYCWHSVEGYSKVGSYTSNNNADNAFVYTGFKPAWVMLKGDMAGNYTTFTIVDNKRDTYNPADVWLTANGACQENYSSNTGGTCISRGDIDIADFVSNGFKIRSSSGEAGGGPATFIYLAFAESPFKYSNAR